MKRHFFDSVSSPVDIGDKDSKQNTSKNLPADWVRLSRPGDNTYLNGQLLSEFRSQYHDFATEEDVNDFIEQEIFPKLALPESKKPEVLAYMQDFFHQQGFMFPVSNTIACTLMEVGNQQGLGLTITTTDFSDQHINITVDATGLSVQEFIEADKLTISAGRDAQKRSADEPGKNYVIKAEGTVHLDFRANASDPVITVKSNKISVGLTMLQPLFTPSRFLDKLWDFIAQFLGRNKVELLEPTKSSSSAENHQASSDTEENAEGEEHSAGRRHGSSF